MEQIKMTHTGFIKLYRSLADHPLWTVKPFSKGQAWVDMLINANHSDGYFYLRGQKVEVKRGQLGWSIVHLGIRWGWSRTKVKNFLNLLEKEQQIIQSQSNITSVVTIVNYEKFQQKKQQTGQQKDIKKTSKRHQKDTNKNDKNDKNEKNDCVGGVCTTQKHTIKSFKKWDEQEFWSKAQEANNGRLSQKDLQAFCEYWTERGDGVKLMLFQRKQTFDVSRRIATWARNDFSIGKQSGDEEVCKENQRRKNELAGQLLKEIYDS